MHQNKCFLSIVYQDNELYYLFFEILNSEINQDSLTDSELNLIFYTSINQTDTFTFLIPKKVDQDYNSIISKFCYSLLKSKNITTNFKMDLISELIKHTVTISYKLLHDLLYFYNDKLNDIMLDKIHNTFLQDTEIESYLQEISFSPVFSSTMKQYCNNNRDCKCYLHKLVISKDKLNNNGRFINSGKIKRKWILETLKVLINCKISKKKYQKTHKLFQELVVYQYQGLYDIKYSTLNKNIFINLLLYDIICLYYNNNFQQLQTDLMKLPSLTLEYLKKSKINQVH